jgi:hypothetical protein
MLSDEEPDEPDELEHATEVQTQPRARSASSCSVCKMPGHNKRKCPARSDDIEAETDDLNSVVMKTSSSSKRKVVSGTKKPCVLSLYVSVVCVLCV